MGEGVMVGVWERSPPPLEAIRDVEAKPPAARGWGFWSKAPSRRRLGVWEQNPQPTEARGSESPVLGDFSIKITRFYVISVIVMEGFISPEN